jgi:hypothetical protein
MESRGRSILDTPHAGYDEFIVKQRPPASIHRNPRELDHLAPFLGLVGNQLAEFGRRHAAARFPKIRSLPTTSAP